MATKKKKSRAKKQFCVWADDVRRVYQHVTADTPQEALDLAKKRIECWDPCEEHCSNGYRLSNEVQDLATEEFIPVHGAKNCRTCGSEIVETINDSCFRDGECGGCEYARYVSQTELLRIARSAANSFTERISCLKDELREDFADTDDIEDQIANYSYLLDQHRKVIANATRCASFAMNETATDDTSTADEREVRKFKESFERFFSLRAEAQIQLAIDILWHVSANWDGDNLVSYPKRMPSFDEFVSALGDKLRQIEWK